MKNDRFATVTHLKYNSEDCDGDIRRFIYADLSKDSLSCVVTFHMSWNVFISFQSYLLCIKRCFKNNYTKKIPKDILKLIIKKLLIPLCVCYTKLD